MTIEQTTAERLQQAGLRVSIEESGDMARIRIQVHNGIFSIGRSTPLYLRDAVDLLVGSPNDRAALVFGLHELKAPAKRPK